MARSPLTKAISMMVSKKDDMSTIRVVFKGEVPGNPFFTKCIDTGYRKIQLEAGPSRYSTWHIKQCIGSHEAIIRRCMCP